MGRAASPADVRVIPTLRKVFAVDLRTLALFRIGLGAVLLADLAMRAGDLRAHYTDDGVLPISLLRDVADLEPGWSMHLFSGSAAWQASLFALAAIAALCLAAGLWTRMATAVSWVLLISLHHRNDALLHSGDELLALLLFWGMFLPLGAYWSCDARRAAAVEEPGAERAGHLFCSFASAGLILQVCCLYLVAGLLKTGPTWRDGSAVQLALGIDEYATPIASWVTAHAWLTTALTYGTVVVELVAPVLLLVPVWFLGCRWLAVIALLGMQSGFVLCMYLGIFPWVNLVALLPLMRFGRSEAPPGCSSWPTNIVASVFVVWILVMAYCDLGESERMEKLPRWMRATSDAIGLNQEWAMFAPDPTDYGGWFVAEAKLYDDTKVDLFADGGEVSEEVPRDVPGRFWSDRWKSFLTVLYDENPGDGALRERLCVYLAARWDPGRPRAQQVRRLRIYYMRRHILPDGSRGEVDRHKLRTYRKPK